MEFSVSVDAPSGAWFSYYVVSEYFVVTVKREDIFFEAQEELNPTLNYKDERGDLRMSHPGEPGDIIVLNLSGRRLGRHYGEKRQLDWQKRCLWMNPWEGCDLNNDWGAALCRVERLLKKLKIERHPTLKELCLVEGSRHTDAFLMEMIKKLNK